MEEIYCVRGESLNVRKRLRTVQAEGTLSETVDVMKRIAKKKKNYTLCGPIWVQFHPLLSLEESTSVSCSSRISFVH